VLPSLDELIENDAGDGAMRHSVSRIAGGDVDVLVGAGILPDVSEIVHRLHYLSRPAVLYALDHGKALPRPFLQAAKGLLVIFRLRLSRLVVLAADDEDLVVRLLA